MKRVWALLPLVVANVGCAGTSPNLSAPQMQTPSLGGGSTGTGRSSGPTGTPNGKKTEPTLPALEPVKTPDGTFVQPPYLQLGAQDKSDSLALAWLAPDDSKKELWSVETRASLNGTWKKEPSPVTTQPVRVGDKIPPHTFVTSPLTALPTGTYFDYRVLRDGKPVFTARALARRTAKDPQRFVVFGDCAQGTAGQKKVAYQTSLAKPDYVVIAGDIVYGRGKASEYAKNFWPVYNAEDAQASVGAPLLRSTLFVAAPGNHDVRSTQLDKDADAFAFYYYWNQPLNGPKLATGAKSITPVTGPGGAISSFQSAAGERYPRMANFSFDYGSAHWSVLDSNSYTDWADPALRQWLENDLKAAQKATWRFVVFHHPPFQTNKEHFNDQWMRQVADLFERYHVAVVFAGHVHDYQRSYPLRFTLEKPRDSKGVVAGKIQVDKSYDGVKNTRATAPIYIVTGAGGATLYQKLENNVLQDFTAKYVDDTHSLTVVDLDSKKMSVKQLSADGKELDSWTVTK